MSLRRLIDALDFEIGIVGRRTAADLAAHPGYRAVQAIHGVGPVLAAVFVAEIGDVTRFPGPSQLCSWAGLTPLHRESDTKVHRGRITKQRAGAVDVICEILRLLGRALDKGVALYAEADGGYPPILAHDVDQTAWCSSPGPGH